MTNTTMMSMLRAAIFSGTVGLLPAVALADDAGPANEDQTAQEVPDHADAQAGSIAGATVRRDASQQPAVPDHAEAEARGRQNTGAVKAEGPSASPDHAQAEARSFE